MAKQGEKQDTIVSKLVKVVEAVERIPKRGENTHFGYRYAMEADVSDVVRVELAKQGLMLIPSVTKYETQRDEKGGVLAILTIRFSVTDGENAIDFDVIGAGHDRPGDKAFYKALTGGTKYAIMKLLLIPTGDDPERDEEPVKEKPKEKVSDLKARKIAALATITEYINATKSQVTLRKFVSDAIGREVNEALTLRDEGELLRLEEQAEALRSAQGAWR